MHTHRDVNTHNKLQSFIYKRVLKCTCTFDPFIRTASLTHAYLYAHALRHIYDPPCMRKAQKDLITHIHKLQTRTPHIYIHAHMQTYIYIPTHKGGRAQTAGSMRGGRTEAKALARRSGKAASRARRAPQSGAAQGQAAAGKHPGHFERR
jgi:hypothetical protein